MAAADADQYELWAERLRDNYSQDEYFNQPRGFPFKEGDFNLDDVVLPPDEDFGIPSDEDDIDEDEIEAETGFGSLIVLDNLPIVPPDKEAKFLDLLKKIVRQVGEIRPNAIWMPRTTGEDGKELSKGYAFIEMLKPESAREAVQRLNEYKFAKNVIRATLFDDFAKYANVPEEYKPLEQAPPVVQPVHTWLLDPRAREQFIIQHRSLTAVYWNDISKGGPEELFAKQYWSEGLVQWSPHGQYVASIHAEGVQLWGGETFEKLGKYKHQNVKHVQFSPNETYVVTGSVIIPDTVETAERPVQAVINIFDRVTCVSLRRFEVPILVEGEAEDLAYLARYQQQLAEGDDPIGNLERHIETLRLNILRRKKDAQLQWPYFKWAGGSEDIYFARLIPNGVSIYECPHMGLLHKKSLNLSHVAGLEWSPVAPILATYQTEQQNQPAKVNLFQVPSKAELKQKSLGFSVQDIAIQWHPSGRFLAVYIERLTKTKRSTTKEFELFRTAERDIPTALLALPSNKDRVEAFEWEPNGRRLAVVHGEERTQRPSVSVYQMKEEKDKRVQAGATLLGTLANENCTKLAWSPEGRFLLIAGLRGSDGRLKFFDCDEWITLKVQEHYMANQVAWDSSGRFLASIVANARMDNSYSIYTFYGHQMFHQRVNDLALFQWRPRPPSLLPPEKQAEIHRQLKEYSRKFDEEDQSYVAQADQSVLAEKQRMLDAWNEWLASKAAWVAQRQQGLEAMLGDKAKEGEFTQKELQGQIVSLDKKVEQVEKVK